LRYMRRHPQISALFHEVPCIKPLVAAYGHRIETITCFICSNVGTLRSRRAVATRTSLSDRLK
jgi:hypothetical protein